MSSAWTDNAVLPAATPRSDGNIWHLVDRRGEYNTLIDEHFSALGPKAANQLRRALDRPPNRFWTEFLWPNLLGETTYVPLSDRKALLRRNPLITFEVADNRADATYFANILEAGDGNQIDEWTMPSKRVVLGPFVVFTMEYDLADIAFIQEQFAWCRSSRKSDLDSPIGHVYRDFRSYSDFAGIVACYGGHKSVHIHVVFRLDEVRDQFALDQQGASAARAGLQHHWRIVAERVSSILRPPVDADRTLAEPEQWRRLPNGLWWNDKPHHILGVPLGTAVPQLVLWEKFGDRAGKGCTSSFIVPTAFTMARTTKVRQRSSSPSVGDMGSDLRDYCVRRLRTLIEEQTGGCYPKLNTLVFEGGRWKAKLRASEADTSAECVIDEDYKTVLERGRHRLASEIELPMTLGNLIALWRSQFEAAPVSLDDAPQGDAPEVLVPRATVCANERPEEVVFRSEAKIREDVPVILSVLTEHVIQTYRNVFVVAPEGSGKTRGIMERHPALMTWLTDDINRRREQKGDKPDYTDYSMFAFASYDLAEEKAREYATMHPGGPYHAVVLRSFSREYHDCCTECGVKPLDFDVPTPEFDRPFVDRIRQQQPRVYAAMQRRHAEFWATLHRANISPVFFTVHQVMQRWTTETLTRVYWHPAFFDDDTAERWELKNGMRLRLAVHDEVGWKHLLWHDHAEVVEWVKTKLARDPDWKDASRSEKLRIFDSVVGSGLIIRDIDQQVLDPKFAECLQIDDLDYAATNLIEITGVEAYDHDDGNKRIYASRHGARWYAKPKLWWEGLADRVVVTTTEALPTAMIDAINPGMKARNRFEVFRFECPDLLAQERVSIHLTRTAISDKVATAIQKLRLELGRDIPFISNRAKTVESTVSHIGARGSNQWAIPELGQLLLHIGPDEYEHLCLVNQVFGLDNAIRLRHVDEFNQACGRNMGFRNKGGHAHHVLVSPRLWDKIKDELLVRSRYGLAVHADADDRARARRIRRGRSSMLGTADTKLAA